jgi:hypothetical protein
MPAFYDGVRAARAGERPPWFGCVAAPICTSGTLRRIQRNAFAAPHGSANAAISSHHSTKPHDNLLAAHSYMET